MTASRFHRLLSSIRVWSVLSCYGTWDRRCHVRQSKIQAPTIYGKLELEAPHLFNLVLAVSCRIYLNAADACTSECTFAVPAFTARCQTSIAFHDNWAI
ncbi:hypothetical protein EVAR_27900_1 [Eumeta japonica]|uniref:Secreted protein n=1 Tax=Eumeta variegata TaxID=151549 RepID=A0A4C1UV20_EUMVA|nr:hypothetical protein EVAR_27900_1 [Eumeta japonica]